MIITIDGLDGAGKSTLAKGLSTKLGYEYIDKPIYELFNVKGDDNYLYDEIYHIQDLIYNKTDSNTLKSYFTGLSLLYIKECMANKNLIIDRGLLSAYAFNGDSNSKLVFEMLLKLGVFFDAAIVVTVSNEERLRRISSRNENDPDLSLDKIRNLRYDSIEKFISEHPDLPCHIINTDNLSEEQVLNDSIEFIQSLKQKSTKKLILKND